MQRFLAWCRRHRTVLLGLAAALAAALIAAWAGYDLARQVDNRPVYEIVNDEYSQTIELTEEGLTQMLPVEAGQTLYGVRLHFTNYGHSFWNGVVTAELYRGQTLLGTAEMSTHGILDNTFYPLIFDTPCTPQKPELLTLHLRFEVPYTEDYPLGIWASEEQVGEMALDAQGRSLNATAAVQYVVDYSGTWSQRLSWVLGVLVFLAVAGGFALLFGPLRGGARLATAIACAALLLGGAFSVVTPPLVAPDEYTHFAASYAQASMRLGQPAFDAENHLYVRAADAPYFGTQTGEIGIFAYKTYLEHLGDSGVPAAADTVSEAVYQKVNPVLYLGQTAGITLARALGRGFHAMLLLGRLGNLLLYTALAAAAVTIAPARWKGLFACAALLPMSLQQAASFSTDAAILGLLFAYTAFCLLLRERPGGFGGAAALIVLTAAVAPLKAIYLPAALLCLLVPADHIDPRRAPKGPAVRLLGRDVRPGVLVKAGALAAAAVLWCIANMGALLYATRDVDNVGLTRGFLALLAGTVALALLYRWMRRHPRWYKWFWRGLAAMLAVVVPVVVWRITHMWGGLEPDQMLAVLPNGDAVYNYTIGYICRNLPGTVKLLLHSVSEQGAHWLQGVLGTTLGEPIVYRIDVSWLLGVGLVLALLASALPRAGQSEALGARARWGMRGIVLCVVGLSVAAALSWTPINYTAIFGLQGRYWLPVLPLALLPLTENRAIAAQRDLARPAAFAVLCLTSLTLLQGYGLYAAWQPAP